MYNVVVIAVLLFIVRSFIRMAWRFKVSKYKNAVGVVPRKEDWLNDIKVGSPQSCGNHIKASAAFMAFNVENRGGGSLAVLPLGSKGRFDPNSPLLHAHSDLITDFDFSPFDDGMLATGSTDANVHIWHIPEGGLVSSLSTPEYTLPQFDKRVENVIFHPTTDFMLTVSYYDTVKLFDILHQKELFTCRGATDQIQGTSWKDDGSLLVTSAKDRVLRVHDPRVSCDVVVQETAGHYSPKDSRVVWLGSTDNILSTGYSQSRIRELWLHDVRNFNKPYKTQQFDSSTGILMPLYDADTRMLFLAGKADVSIMYWEVQKNEPHLTEGLKHTGGVQTKGACLVPKRGVDAMSGEVNRLLQLTTNAVIPITYQVPRKTFREFHSDLFPATCGSRSPHTVQEWLEGSDKIPATVSLDPARRNAPTLQLHRGHLAQRSEEEDQKEQENKKQEEEEASIISSSSSSNNHSNGVHSNGSSNGVPVPAPRSRTAEGGSSSNGGSGSTFPTNRPDRGVANVTKPTVAVKKSDLSKSDSDERDCSAGSGVRDNNDDDNPGDNKQEDEPSSKLASLRAQFESRNSASDDQRSNDSPANDTPLNNSGGVGTPSSPGPQRRNATSRTRSFRRICKFRHLKGTAGHRNTQIENLRDLSRTIPGESDGIACNSSFVALPLSGAGGKVSVNKHQKGGRLPDGVIPAFMCGANVLDFTFDPFNEDVLYTGCDDGNIMLWRIPEEGLLRSTNTPERTFCDSTDKVTFLRPHPLASGIMAACCGDLVIRIWDLEKGQVAIALLPHPDQVFSAAWSPCGLFLATLCRDGRVRVFDPRKSGGPCAEGPGPTGVRGGRILWALDGKFLITCGASKSSQREVSLYRANDLTAAVATLPLDQSPAILMPHYDPDSSTLFVTAKGESTIYCYEVGSDAPYLFPLSHHKSPSVHQGLSFLPKLSCDVRAVEFARALRLTHTTLEPLSFTVPRVKTSLFQDDLFPPTAVLWQPQLTAAEWCSGVNRCPALLSLQPEDMAPLSGSRDSPPSEDSPPPRHTGPAPRLDDVMPSFTRSLPEGVRQTQHKLEQSMSEQITVTSALEQDCVEGVDTEEWLDE